VIDFLDQCIDLDVTAQVLTAATARQVHELSDLALAFLAQFVVDCFDVDLSKQALWRVLEFANLHWQFLNFHSLTLRH